MQVERKLEFYTPIMLLLMACFLMLFSFYANKVEASEVTILTMDEDIKMNVRGVEIKNGLGEKILRFVDVNNPSIFFTKYHQNINEVKLLDGTYHIYDLTKYANGDEEVDYKAHDGLTPIGQVTVADGERKNAPVVINYNDSGLYLTNSDMQLTLTSTENGGRITGESGKKLKFVDVNDPKVFSTKIDGVNEINLQEGTYKIYDVSNLTAGFMPGDWHFRGVVNVTKTPPSPSVISVTLVIP